jgi:hypothetical protein
MSTVTNINKNRARRATQISVGTLERELRTDLTKPEVLNAAVLQSPQLLIEEVEAVASEHCVRRLEMQHRREQFERDMAAEEAELDAELEHAAYFAFMAGADETDIYNLDTRTAEALTKAITKAQARA